MSEFDYAKCRSRLERALRVSANLPDPVASDIAFHILDWEVELWALVDLLGDPEGSPDDRVVEILEAFLLHAASHIAAAHKLLTGDPVRDTFEVGAVAPGDEER